MHAAVLLIELPTKTSILDMLSGRSPAPELQDIEVNSLLQRHHIQVENCSDVSITMKQIEVEKVVEAALVVLNQRRQQFRRQEADDPRRRRSLSGLMAGHLSWGYDRFELFHQTVPIEPSETGETGWMWT